MWHIAVDFISANWKAISTSVGVVVSALTYIFRFSSWANQRQLKKDARRIQDYVDGQRRREPNLHAIGEDGLAAQLGRRGKRILDVLEFMAEKKLAVRLNFPVGYWRIGDTTPLPFPKRWL